MNIFQRLLYKWRGKWYDRGTKKFQRTPCKWLNSTFHELDLGEEGLFKVSFYCNCEGILNPIGPGSCRNCNHYEPEKDVNI